MSYFHAFDAANVRAQVKQCRSGAPNLKKPNTWKTYKQAKWERVRTCGATLKRDNRSHIRSTSTIKYQAYSAREFLLLVLFQQRTKLKLVFQFDCNQHFCPVIQTLYHSLIKIATQTDFHVRLMRIIIQMIYKHNTIEEEKHLKCWKMETKQKRVRVLTIVKKFGLPLAYAITWSSGMSLSCCAEKCCFVKDASASYLWTEFVEVARSEASELDPSSDRRQGNIILDEVSDNVYSPLCVSCAKCEIRKMGAMCAAGEIATGRRRFPSRSGNQA